jgi:hypothetical protein
MKIRIVTFALMMLFVSVRLYAADPFVGTWKLNVAKSKFNGDAPKSRILKIEPSGNAFKLTMENTDAKGKRTTRSYAANFDGKDYPDTSEPGRDTIAWKRIDPNTWEATAKKDGKVTGVSKRTLTPDGKMLTIAGMNPEGRSTYVSVYDKQ